MTDGGRSGEESPPAQRTPSTLASPVPRQRSPEAAEASQRTGPPGVTTGAPWGCCWRFSLAFVAFPPVFSPVLPAFLPALLPSNQRRMTTPHMEGCPSWEFFPTIPLPALYKLANLPRTTQNDPTQE